MKHRFSLFWFRDFLQDRIPLGGLRVEVWDFRIAFRDPKNSKNISASLRAGN